MSYKNAGIYQLQVEKVITEQTVRFTEEKLQDVHCPVLPTLAV